METLWQFPSIEGTPRLHPSPAPHPTPRRALPGLRTPRRPPGAPGLGRGPSLPVRKTFPGIFLRGLVSDWAFRGGKGGGEFRWYFSWAGFSGLALSALPREAGSGSFNSSAPSPAPPGRASRTPPRGLQPPSQDCPCRGPAGGSGREAVRARGWASGAAPARRSFLPWWVPVRLKQAQEPSPGRRLRVSGRSEA